jgi:hypothetical protein
MNPDLAGIAPLLDQEYTALNELENQLKEAGGYFNISYEFLEDPMKCQKIARIMKQFPDVYSRICDVIEYSKPRP